MNKQIIDLVNRYWKFDNDQCNLSTWHDKNDLIAEIEALTMRGVGITFKEKCKTELKKWYACRLIGGVVHFEHKGKWFTEDELINYLGDSVKNQP